MTTLHQHNACPLQDHGNILQEGSHARPKSKLCWCPVAFVKGYHKCKGLKHQRVILSLCWGLKILKSVSWAEVETLAGHASSRRSREESIPYNFQLLEAGCLGWVLRPWDVGIYSHHPLFFYVWNLPLQSFHKDPVIALSRRTQILN